MQSRQRFRTCRLMPEISRKNVEKTGGGQDRGGELFLALDIMLRELGIGPQAVGGQVVDVTAVKPFIVADALETCGGVNPQADSSETDEHDRDEGKAAKPG